MTPMFTRKSTVYRLKRAALAVLWLLPFTTSFLYGGSIRFNNRVIDPGMSKGKVFLIAGQPDWKASYVLGDGGIVGRLGSPVGGFSDTSLVTGYSGHFAPFGSVTVEEWLFNRGPYRLMQLFRFEDERLVAIESVGYGFDENRTGKVINPNWSTLRVGDTSYEVRNKVGEPSLTETKPEIGFVRITGPRYHTLHFRSAEVSWWYYNLGGNRLFRILKLVNGRVFEIETEGYGLSDE